MKAWWDALQPRERQVLLAGAVALLSMLLYVAVIDPWGQAYSRLEQRVASQAQDIAWMEQAAREVATLRGNGAAGKPADRGGQSLMTLIDTSARSAGLGESLKRVQPESDGRVRVWFEGASFDGLLGWVDTLINRYGVAVDSLAVERGKGPGQVDVRALLGETP